MQPIDALTNEAVALLKRGVDPSAVVHQLMERGADPQSAHALVTRLVQLKQQAEANDPKRLLQQAAAMIAQGASGEQALQVLTSAGIAEVHARPEIEKLLAAHHQRLASLRPCGRCGTLTAPADFYFDRLGNQVCERCNAVGALEATEQRIEDARLEAAGVSPLAIQENNRLQWCPRCQDHSAVLDHATHTMFKGMTNSMRVFRCTRCHQTV
jgi:hypothetical protein